MITETQSFETRLFFEHQIRDAARQSLKNPEGLSPSGAEELEQTIQQATLSIDSLRRIIAVRTAA